MTYKATAVISSFNSWIAGSFKTLYYKTQSLSSEELQKDRENLIVTKVPHTDILKMTIHTKIEATQQTYILGVGYNPWC